MANQETILTKLWNNITSVIPILGRQRSISTYNYLDDTTAIGRAYDLEISEYPVRDSEKAHKLIEMWEYCPEIATAIEIITNDVFSSDDGDDQGFAIGEFLNDDVTPINPKVKILLEDLIERLIGGLELERAVERILIYGDAFASLGIDFSKKKILKLLFLPTWELFRIEDNYGNLIRFEQRRYLANSFENKYKNFQENIKQGEAIMFHPLQIVHWRFRQKNLYGRSLFFESISDWNNLKASTDDLAFASRSVGINPNIHIMPDCVDEDYRKAYKLAYEEKKKQGMVTDFYLMCGADIKKLSQANPDIKALSDTVLMWRTRIVMKSHVPPWLMGLPTIGARDIAGQPALAYARFINKIRMNLTVGIRQICDLELALNDIPKEQWKYKIIFPKIATNPYGNNAIIDDETNNNLIEDLDDA
jgi:hypothetical protein